MRVTKVWAYELSYCNKFPIHNPFVNTFVTLVVAILHWTLKEISKIDVHARKILLNILFFFLLSLMDCNYIQK